MTYEPKRVSLIWIILLALVVAAIVFDVSYADDIDVRQSNDMNNQTTGNVSTGDSSWGIGAGGPGGVEINDCWGSTQWGGFTIFRQKLVQLETCLGFEFLRIDQYEIAAMHFCNDKATLKEYSSEVECEIDHDFSPSIIEGELDLGGLYDQAAQFNEHYELAQQQEEEIEYLQEENASIVGRLEALTARIEQAPATVPVQVQTQIQQQENVAEQRRLRAKEAYLKALEGSE